MTKHTLTFLFSLFIATWTQAQIDRSVVPEAAPAPEIAIDLTAPVVLDNGLKVIVVASDRVPTVSMSLRLNYDPIFEGEKVGSVQLFGDLWGAGTTERSKAEINENVEFLGASWSTSSRGVRVSGLSKHVESLMAIMAEVVMKPAFPEEEFEKIKRKSLSSLEAEENNPSAIASSVRAKALYGNAHPYGEVTTPATIEKIQVSDCMALYNEYVHPNEAYFVIVGDVNPKKAVKMVKKYLGDWARADVPSHQYASAPTFQNTQVAFADRPGSVQSVLSVANTFEMKPGHPDAIALTVANQVLGGGSSARLFKNLREDKAYTYGAYSRIDIDESGSSFVVSANLRNAVTDSAIAQMFYEIERMRSELVPQEELDAAISYLLGSFARSLESPTTVAGFAVNTDQYGLSPIYYKEYLQKLKAVTPEEVLRVSKAYFGGRNALVTVVGAYDEVGGLLSAFGDVTFYSNYAEQVEEPSMPIPDSVTVNSVLGAYFDAIGGLDVLKSIQRVEYAYNMDVQGQQLALNRTLQLPGKSLQTIGMGNFVIQKAVTDGTDAMVLQNGAPFPLTEEQKRSMINEAVIFPELNWLDPSFESSVELVSLKKIGDGSSTYVIKVTDAEGDESFHYFDASSGLKVMTMEYAVGPSGEEEPQSTRYSNYSSLDSEVVNGAAVRVPQTIQVPMGPQTVTSTLVSAKFNGRSNKGEFAID